MRYVAMIMVMLMVSGPAIANDYHPFKNGVTLAKYMRSQGLEPTNVDWRQVDQLCAGQLSMGTDVYQRCRYEHAQANLLHRSDRRECATVAESDYPRSLQTQRQYVQFQRSGRFQYVDQYRRDISSRELRTHRSAGVINCMKDLGWASASNWQLGPR